MRQEIWQGERELANKASMRMGDWLNGYKWTFFFTGTRRDYGTVEAIRYSFYWLIGQIEQREGVPVASFYGIEGFKSGEAQHVHSVIFIDWKEGLLGPPIARDYWRLWFNKYGRNKVCFYDYNLGASWYCARYIAKQGVTDYGLTGEDNWRKRQENIDEKIDTVIDTGRKKNENANDTAIDTGVIKMTQIIDISKIELIQQLSQITERIVKEDKMLGRIQLGQTSKEVERVSWYVERGHYDMAYRDAVDILNEAWLWQGGERIPRILRDAAMLRQRIGPGHAARFLEVILKDMAVGRGIA